MQSKYFYRVFEEEDGIYKETIGLGQLDVFSKEGKGIFLNFQMGMFIKASLKIVLEKEKEFINIQMGLFMKASIKWFKVGKRIERYADGNVYEGEFKIIK